MLFQFLLLCISDIIEYNNDETGFKHKGINLGNNMNETINFLTTPNAYELKEELGK